MNGKAFVYSIGQRVKLRGEVGPTFYNGMAKTGNEGWIRGQRRDRFGLPEVFIHWDRNHWAYNHQPDTWTFQEHFDLVEEPMSEKEDPKESQVLAAATSFAQQLAAIFKGETNEVAKSDIPSGPDPAIMRYAATVEQATQILPGSESFLCIAISREPDPRAPNGLLSASVLGDSLTPEAEILTGAQIAKVGSKYHESLAMLCLRNSGAISISDDEEEDGPE